MTTLVSLSGGLDSTATALLAVRRQGAANVRAYAVDYGQRHVREIDSARAVADHLGIPLEVIDVTGLLTKGSALVEGGEVPHGHYAEDSMSATVVLGRNLMFASALIGQADEGDTVMVGVHGGDHFVYPDCRPSFWTPFAEAVAAAYNVTVETPWIEKDKTAIAASFAPSDLDLAALTWSCYEGGDIHCGRCGTCVERAEAFDLAGVPDPTEYADPNFWREVVAG